MKPGIRFGEFTDAWEQRKLSDVAEIVGGGTPSTSNDEYWDGDIDWYTPAEINNQIFADSSERKITELGLQKSSAKILPADKTVLFTSRAGIGKMAILRRPGATNQGFQSLVLNDETDPYFIFSIGSMIKESAERVASGSTFAEISGKMLGNLEFMFPNEYEQRKIGEYFQSIDNLITLHQRKLDKMKNLKSAYLSKMFPKEGEKYPRLRFAGFTDAWEQRKLDNIADVRDGTHDSPQYYSKGHPLVTSKNVKDGYINYDDIQYISDADFEMINKRSKVEKNDILMGMIGTIGNIALVREEPDFAIKNVALIKDIKKIYYIYLYHNLQSSNILDQLSEGMDGGTQKFIALNKIRNLTISIPKYEEQQKIGTFFTSLDNLITLHQRELEKLKQLKQAMLQKMFV
jgi:type I restriction enzyme S subunit